MADWGLSACLVDERRPCCADERRETEEECKKGTTREQCAAMYPDHCVGSIEKKKVIWIVTGKNGGGKKLSRCVLTLI